MRFKQLWLNIERYSITVVLRAWRRDNFGEFGVGWRLRSRHVCGCGLASNVSGATLAALVMATV